MFVACVLGFLLALGPASEAADPFFDARGFQPNRDFFRELPFEHIDPMTGNVLLTFTDLVLPGNAGFDLRIQRTYNSKIYDIYSNSGGFTLDEDNWAGIGWRLHMGRVLNPKAVSPGPIIEMPDGSRHQLYLHMDGNLNHYITKDYWTYDNVFQFPVLRLPNGLKYTFGHSQGGPFYVTEIEDPFGNKVVVSYARPPAPADVIASISQQLVGGQTRTITFTHDATLPSPRGPQAAGSLATMTFNGRTWTYRQQLTNVFTYTQLMEVKPPVGPSWTFDYDDTNPQTLYLLNHVDTPNGGDIDYTYTPQIFYIGSSVLYSPAVIQRQTSGRSVPSGTWTYAYSSSTDKNETVITSPSTCGTSRNKTTYEFLGIGPNANQDAWAIGALAKRTTASTAGTTYETENLRWTSSVPISNVPESGSSPQTHVALLGRRVVARSGREYTTTYTYSPLPYSSSRPNNFNDYGRSDNISETGDSTRTAFRTFFYGSSNDPSFGTYIVDKTASETVELGSESFTKSYTYSASTGFKTSETIYGITTTYVAHSSGSGNVGRATDENKNSTLYSYSGGVPSQIQTPNYTISRSINSDGTIASETRRGFTTTFSYDALSRPTQTRPPIGNAINTVYDTSGGSSVTVTRGPASLRTDLDGLGRPIGTENGVSIRTTLEYDACGRTVFESYPFLGGTATGTTYTYDPIGRMTRRTHPDNSFVSYAYSQGVDVSITDEEVRLTKQDWSGFGDPGDARLAAVTDANNITTPYVYNALGNLKSVTLPGGGATRSWTYNSKNQLITEDHPENGQTSYTYDPAGNLETRTDRQFGATTFSYDGNNRLIGIDRPGSSYDTSIAYDASDNRTSLVTADVSSTFAYDGANRPTSRTDDLDGVVLSTTYEYDANDTLKRLTYPSGTKVEYKYDSENRITRVENSAGVPYADQFGYHPSGALSAYLAGNGLRHQFTYDPRYRLKTLDEGGARRLRLIYTYDKVSNVKTIQDPRRAQFRPAFEYDALDRLRQVTVAFRTPSFTYDPKGNRLTKQIGSATTTYTYDTASQLLISATGAEPDSFTYDLNGNMIASTAGTYSYAPTNLMVNASVGGSSTSYLYDGDDLRKAKVRSAGTSYYVHGPGGQLLGEYTENAGSLGVVREYVLAGTRLIADLVPTLLAVNPPSLSFIAVLDEGAPSPQNLALSTNGNNVSWTATDNAPWLRVSPASGVTPATLSVSVDASTLQPGTYSGSVTISASGAGSPVVVPVQLTVFATASLYLSPTTVSFYQPAGGPNPQPSAVQVLYTSGSPVAWQATTADAWISISPSSGNTPGTLNVSVSGQGLPPGTHHGSVTIDSPTNPGNPQTLAVEFVIGPGPGTGCAPDASYCEIFDDEPRGDLEAGWVWSEPNAPQVVADPRGTGNVMLLDPPPGARLNGDVNLATPQAISGTEISVQVMTTGTNPNDPRSLAKIEFYTEPGKAWAKTTRTFGTLRFGSNLRFQYGPTNYQMLVKPMQPGRWYAVRVRYVGGQAEVYVDGDLRFTSAAPDPALQMEAFSLTAWDFAPGAAYADLLEVRPPELLVDPMSLELQGTPAGSCSPGLSARTPSGTLPSSASHTRPRTSTIHVPAAFEPNVGQADPSVKFIARAAGHLVLVRSHDITLALLERPQPLAKEQPYRRDFAQRRHHAASRRPRVAEVRMKLGLPDRPLNFQAQDSLPGVSHYLVGDDPRAWHRNVRRYGRLVAKDIYPGIDIVLRDHKSRVEYDLVVAPEADPAQIELEFEGASGLKIDEAGDLVITTSLGQEVRQPRPLIYQEDGGVRRRVAGRYAKRSERSVAFELSPYDRTKTLVIDPVLAWTVQFGGSDIEEPHDMAHDTAGDVYVTGPALSPDLSSTNVFVAKLTGDGSGLIYSTYLGEGEGQGIAVDGSGNAIVTGPTGPGFPQVPPSSPRYGPGGLDDVFVAKLSADGSQLLFATKLGGTSFEDGHGVAVDSGGRIYLTGITTSADFPMQNPTQPTMNGGGDAFIAALSSNGQQLIYSTYFGGSAIQDEFATSVAADGNGEAFVTGITDAPDFPGASGCGPSLDAFVIRLSSTGALLGSRCFGGSAEDGAEDIDLRPGGGPVISGETASPDFPAVQALGPYAGGPSDAFVTEFSADLSQVLFSTPFGGSESDGAGRVVTNATGEIYVVGLTASNDLPVVSPVSCGQAVPPNLFVIKIGANRQLLYSTYLPAAPEPGFWQAMTLAQGGVYVGWMAAQDAFVVKLLDPTPPGTVHLTPISTSVCEGTPVLMRAERLDGVPGTLILDYEPKDGTATAPFDYDGTPGSVTLGDTVCAATISIPTFLDVLEEPHETFSVELSGANGPVSVLGATILGNGTASAQFTVQRRNQPTGPTWQAAVDVPWLTLDAYSGFGPSTVTVTADPTGLANGTYLGRITVTADVTGSPQVVQVTLTVSNQPLQ